MDAGMPVFVVPSRQIKGLGTRYGSAGNKDDRFDAYVLADTLRALTSAISSGSSSPIWTERKRMRAAMPRIVETVTRCSTLAVAELASASTRSSCLTNETPRGPARRCSGAVTMTLLSSLMAFVRLTSTAWRVLNTRRNASRSPRARGVDWCCEDNAWRAACVRVDAVILGAARAFEAADLDDILTGGGQAGDQSGSEAGGAFERPHPPARRVLLSPCQQTLIAGSIRRPRRLGSESAPGRRLPGCRRARLPRRALFCFHVRS